MARTKTPRSRRPRRPVARTARPSAPVRSARATSGLAPGMQAINAYLAVADVSASMTFATSAGVADCTVATVLRSIGERTAIGGPDVFTSPPPIIAPAQLSGIPNR